MRIKKKGGVSYIREGKIGRFSKLLMWDKIKRENWALVLIKPKRLYQNKIKVVTKYFLHSRASPPAAWATRGTR